MPDYRSDRPVGLVLYALPNGNTIEQTAGKKMAPGDDWHFDIQHIAAQTRFLRERIEGYNLVVAYLEADQKSWPAWKKAHPDHAGVLYVRATLRAKIGDIGAAVRDLRRVLEIQPDHRDAKHDIELLLLRQRQGGLLTKLFKR